MLDLVDLVLVMTVNPGFGGQSYIATMEPKITEVRRMIDDAGLGDTVDVEVDGGIGPSTIAGAAGAGANVLIAGSALFKDPLGLEHAVTDLRARAEAARRPSAARHLNHHLGRPPGPTGSGECHTPSVRSTS